jgi:hypothetical protein
MFDYNGGRKKSTEPGNDMGLYMHRPRGMGRMPVEALKPSREKWGVGLAKFILLYAYCIHFVLIPAFILGLYMRLELPWLYYLLTVTVPAGLIIIPVGRIIANRLTRDEEDTGYRAVMVFSLGFAVWFLLGLVLSLIA